MTSQDNKNTITALEDRKKLTDADWKNLKPEAVEKILQLLGVKEIENKKNLSSLIKVSKTPFKALQNNILIDFYGVWCGPCRLQDKMFARHGVEILRKCFPDIQIYRCDVDKTQKIDKFTRKLGIDAIPILAYLNDKVHFMWAGNKKIETIVDFINKHTTSVKNEKEIAKITQ